MVAPLMMPPGRIGELIAPTLPFAKAAIFFLCGKVLNMIVAFSITTESVLNASVVVIDVVSACVAVAVAVSGAISVVFPGLKGLL